MVSTVTQSTTSTTASTLPVPVSKAASYWSRIAVVNVGKRSIDSTPNSASRCSATSRQPPSTAGRSWGSTMRAKVRQRPSPREREVSSHERSSPRRAADTGRKTSG